MSTGSKHAHGWFLSAYSHTNSIAAYCFFLSLFACLSKPSLSSLSFSLAQSFLAMLSMPSLCMLYLTLFPPFLSYFSSLLYVTTFYLLDFAPTLIPTPKCSVIKRLWAGGSTVNKQINITEQEILQLCRKSRVFEFACLPFDACGCDVVLSGNHTPNIILWKEILLQQDMLLELNPPIRIVGDIHGQFHDLLQVHYDAMRGNIKEQKTGSRFVFCRCLSSQEDQAQLTTYFSATMWIEANRALKLYVSFLHIK